MDDEGGHAACLQRIGACRDAVAVARSKRTSAMCWSSPPHAAATHALTARAKLYVESASPLPLYVRAMRLTKALGALVGAAAVLAAGALTTNALAGNVFAFVPASVEQTRAYQYARTSNALCLAELAERKVPFEHVANARGVETPIRLTGRVRGIKYVQTFRADMNPKAAATVLDCR